MKTIQEILAFCRENLIQMVDFKMIDLLGRWRHLTFPVDRLTENTMRYGIGFDGSNYGYASVENSDMVFIPDLESAVIDPFAQVKTLSMMGDVMTIGDKENKPFDQYPRNVALRAEEYMRSLGVADQMICGPEYEFYLFDSMRFETLPNRVFYEVDAENAEWNSGQFPSGYIVPHKGNYHLAPPHDTNLDLRSQMCLLMEEWGVKVKYHHTEVGGCGQQEIEVEYDSMTRTADKAMIAKYIIKNAAVQAGKTATLMPKPVRGEAGSGMHVHMQLFKDGSNLFYSENGYSHLSDTALWFIGGILKHASSLCGITNPSTNSYKRLVPGFEAPVTVGYATANRSAVIRIPAYAKSPQDKCFELRNPDATCNMYYALAAILMAGLDGVKNRIDPKANGWGPYDFNLFDLPEEERKKIGGLPKSLGEALDALEKDHAYLTAGGVFPERLISQWIKRKRAELESVERMPHPAEFALYYDL
ncbi:MAG: type I glutamate--ammonia ligase [Bacillota bacterium]|nr:type I glutamate--ammonia ligase [Bacillota bacterium]